MKFHSILSSLLLVTVSSSMTSCFSTSKVDSKNQASVGKQLTDLDAAYKQGVITEKDYLKLKKAIINDND
jgi:hypothetical protein